MKLKVTLLLTLSNILFCSFLNSQNRNQAYLTYINQYYQLAVKQQNEYGIPASITLAQGLLESGAGKSSFALESNNHFGIKCNEWAGDKIYHDDDLSGECFRKYNDVLQSYEDHSLFLKNKPRYSFLFEFRPTDYEAWAFGLKKAGYATDPTYAFKLISIIENYELHQFDLGKGQTFTNYKTVNSTNQSSNLANSGTQPNKTYLGAVVALVSHEVRKVNNIKFITSLPEDNYALIADEFNMSVERLLIYNDLTFEKTLTSGTRIFIAPKKNKAPKECLTHQILPGESMYSISQDYGIKIQKLYKLNKMPFTQIAYIGQVLKLR